MAPGTKAAPKKKEPDPWVKPQPTKINGGKPGILDRMIACFEECRDLNTAGYGQWVVKRVKGWINPASQPTLVGQTSCSPFTATVTGMMFDPDSPVTSDIFNPKYDNGTKPLEVMFYTHHNLTGADIVGAAEIDATAKQKNKSSPGSVALWGLGYDIDPKDMRRGDLVGIFWGNGGGHSVFCWDVHVTDGVVDAFQFVSSNTRKEFDPDEVKKLGKDAVGVGCGVTVAYGSAGLGKFVVNKGGVISRAPGKPKLFVDDPDYIKWGSWYGIPGVAKKSIDLKTFKDPQPTWISYANDGDYSIANLRVVRFFGFTPPTRAQTDPKYNFDVAKTLGYETQPESYATGTGTATAPQITNAPATKVTATPATTTAPSSAGSSGGTTSGSASGNTSGGGSGGGSGPAKIDPKTVPVKPVTQAKTDPLAHQREVESMLEELYNGSVLKTSPGDTDNVNDEETQNAVKEFQQLFNLKVDGNAGPKTRAEMQKQVKLLRDKNAAEPDDAPPTIEHLYWMKNQCAVNGIVVLKIAGKHLEKLQKFDAYLSEPDSDDEFLISLPLIARGGTGHRRIQLPPDFHLGAKIVARVEATAKDGTLLKADCDAPMYVRFPDAGAAGPDWSPYIGAGAVPDDICDAIRAARAAVPSVALKSYSPKGVYKGKYYSPTNSPHTKWVAQYLTDKAASQTGVEKMRIMAFKAFQPREGSTCAINTYDSEIVTWGSGFSGKATMGNILGPLEKSPEVTKLFNDCGFKWAGQKGTAAVLNTYHCVDLTKKKVVSGQDDALKVIWADDQLCYMLAYASQGPNTRGAVVDAMLSTFAVFKGAEKITNQALFNFILHLHHWMPRFANGMSNSCFDGKTEEDIAHACSTYFFTWPKSKTDSTRAAGWPGYSDSVWQSCWDQHLRYYDHMAEDGLTVAKPTKPT